MLLLWPLVVEPILGNLPDIGSQVGPYLPFGNAFVFADVQWLFPVYSMPWDRLGSLVYFAAIVAARLRRRHRRGEPARRVTNVGAMRRTSRTALAALTVAVVATALVAGCANEPSRRRTRRLRRAARRRLLRLRRVTAAASHHRRDDGAPDQAAGDRRRQRRQLVPWARRATTPASTTWPRRCGTRASTSRPTSSTCGCRSPTNPPSRSAAADVKTNPLGFTIGTPASGGARPAGARAAPTTTPGCAAVGLRRPARVGRCGAGGPRHLPVLGASRRSPPSAGRSR